MSPLAVLGTDVVLDFIGGSYFDNHTKCMALDGRLVLLGLVSAPLCTPHYICLFTVSFCSV